LTRGCRQETWVVGEHAALPIELANVNDVWTNVAAVNGHFNARAAVTERQGGFVVSKFHDSISSVNQSIYIVLIAICLQTSLQ
jgi:hypothetical protein